MAEVNVARNIVCLCRLILFRLINTRPIIRNNEVRVFKKALTAGSEFTQETSPSKAMPVLKKISKKRNARIAKLKNPIII